QHRHRKSGREPALGSPRRCRWSKRRVDLLWLLENHRPERQDRTAGKAADHRATGREDRRGGPVTDWFSAIAADSALSPESAARLRRYGFCIVPGPVPAESLPSLARAYDQSMAEADPADRSEGRTTVRVHDFVNRGVEFDALYTYAPLLAA